LLVARDKLNVAAKAVKKEEHNDLIGRGQYSL